MNNADTYCLRHTKILKLITKKQYTAQQIFKETRIPIASIYRILDSLLKNNKITNSKTKSPYTGGNRRQIYKLKVIIRNDKR